MKKLILLILYLFLTAPLFAIELPPSRAKQIRTDTSLFNTVLSVSDTTVQKALDTLDNLNILTPGGVSGDLQYYDVSSLGGITATDYDKSTGNFIWTTDKITFSGMNSFKAYIPLTAVSGLNTKYIVMASSTLDSNEWAYLDGQDQAVRTDSSPTFAVITTTNIIKSTPRAWDFDISNPNAVWIKDREIFIAKTLAPLTITQLDVSNDTSAYNTLGDIKYADAFIGFANSVVINDFDTTNGVRLDNTITSGAVPANKAVYLSYDASPSSSITQTHFHIGWDYD